MKKDTIYVDLDDEITTITDRVQSSKERVIALVLPKRCVVLQSAVNMKILSKITKEADKKVVLITEEASLLPLAGAAGLHVAKSLQSQPYLPDAIEADEKITTIKEKTEEKTAEPELDSSKPIGELAVAAGMDIKDDDETPIELAEDLDDKKSEKTQKKKKDKRFHVPNFEKFRLWLILVIIAVLGLIGGSIYAFKALPKAVVTVTIQNQTIPISLTATGSPTATTVDLENKIVPMETKTLEESASKTFTATGEKNIGNKATGTMKIINCTDPTITVPAGTTFTNSGYAFTVNEAVEVIGSNFTSGGDCKEDGYVTDVAVTAVSGGESYNLSAGRIYSSSLSSSVTGVGSAMGGGTDNVVTAVSQADCDAAKNELLITNTDDYKNQLSAQLTTAGLLPLRDTFSAQSGEVTCSPAVGEQASEATASLALNLSMAGASMTSLDQLIKAEVAKLENQQSVFDSGVTDGIVSIKAKNDAGEIAFGLQVYAQTGIQQDANAIAELIAGKKYGESVSILEAQSGVQEVQISYSPFWVSQTPGNIDRITVNFISQ